LKILFPFVGDSIGGSHISTLELYSSLVDANIDAIIVLHIGCGKLAKYLRARNIPFYVLNSYKLAGENPKIFYIFFGIFANFISFSVFIKKHKIDIVHGNDLRINLSWSLPSQIFSKGFVWHQRTLLSKSKLWILIRFLCSYFVAISDVVMQSSPKNISERKKKIVYNPFNVSAMADKASARSQIIKNYNINNSFFLGYVGRIVEYKNITLILKSFSLIQQKDFYLLIVGSGSEFYINKLKLYADCLGIKNKVIFTGFVNNPVNIISSLDVLIASSDIDAFGRTIVEAMLQKTPVVAAKSGGHVEIIKDGVNGIFYNAGDEIDLCEKILFIRNNPNFKDNMVRDAYLFAKNKFSSEVHLLNIMNIYDLVVKD